MAAAAAEGAGTAAAAATAVPAAGQPAAQSQNSGWTLYTDPATGHPYYHNAQTKQSVWAYQAQQQQQQQASQPQLQDQQPQAQAQPPAQQQQPQPQQQQSPAQQPLPTVQPQSATQPAASPPQQTQPPPQQQGQDAQAGAQPVVQVQPAAQAPGGQIVVAQPADPSVPSTYGPLVVKENGVQHPQPYKASPDGACPQGADAGTAPQATAAAPVSLGPTVVYATIDSSQVSANPQLAAAAAPGVMPLSAVASPGMVATAGQQPVILSALPAGCGQQIAYTAPLLTAEQQQYIAALQQQQQAIYLQYAAAAAAQQAAGVAITAAGGSGQPSTGWIINRLIEREKARIEKNYSEADRLRAQLREQGVEVDDRLRTWSCKDGRKGHRPNHNDPAESE